MQNQTWRIGALCAAVACGTIACARAVRVESESSGAIAVTPANTRMLPAGVDMLLGLDQAVGTKNSRVGQEFSATLQDDVRAQNGRVVVPEGAKVYGHVTAIHEGKIDKPAAIRLDFDRLAFNGRSYPFEASIVATDHRTSRAPRINGRDVAVGALAGGVLGAIIGEATSQGSSVRGTRRRRRHSNLARHAWRSQRWPRERTWKCGDAGRSRSADIGHVPVVHCDTCGLIWSRPSPSRSSLPAASAAAAAGATRPIGHSQIFRSSRYPSRLAATFSPCS